MAIFNALVHRLDICEHPNADQLEIARIGEYQVVVRKGEYKNGNLAAYIPEQAIVPKNLLEEMGLVGKLAGKDKNKVKAIRLRGVLSQGLLYPAREDWKEGDNVTDILGITKWITPIPAHLSGEIFYAGSNLTIKYDIENYKRFPHVLVEGEKVVFAEKIHGTWTMIGYLPEKYAHPQEGRLLVSSKGLSARGMALKINEKNKVNLYVRIATHYNMIDRISNVFTPEINNLENPKPVYVLGEIFGSTIQDLSYGYSAEKDERIGFKIFDIYIGLPGHGRYLNDTELDSACKQLGLSRVPVLYRGPYNKEIMYQYTDGLETVSGKEIHIREGIIVRPVIERYSEDIGRVQVKSVSESYLTRKGGTEFN